MTEDRVPVRILVVEDDEDSAELLSEIFQSRGHIVEVCREGCLALELMGHFHPQVALLDVGLPDMSGYELAQKLRVIAGASSLRLIALTGYGSDAERLRSHEAGFDAHFVKPVHPDVLIQAIEESASVP